jgi:GNAT superfamily N-acetyltransferase
MADRSPQRIAVRPYEAHDAAFLASIAQRLNPQQSTSPRDPVTMERFFADLAHGRLLSEPGSEAFVATIDGAPGGIVAVHPDADYFTGHPRAYVDILVVAEEAEGRGVGSALMRHVERWARDHGCLEVVLDVFAGNAGATAFYERNGYRPDHIRMTKSLM